MKKLTILVVLNDDQFFISNFLPLFKELQINGFEIQVASPNTGSKDKIESEGFKFYNIPVRREARTFLSNLFLAFSLFSLYRQVKPDIIHHITLKVILIGTFVSLFGGRKKVLNHFCGLGFIFTLPSNNSLKWFTCLLLRCLMFLKRAKLLFENEDDRIEIIKGIGINSARTSIINGTGIDLNVYSYTNPPSRQGLQILFPGRLILTKGIMDFIETAELCFNELNGKVKFVLAGKIDIHNPAYIPESSIRSRLRPDYIEWIGFTDNMKKEMEQSDIIVLPSYREGLSKSLVEACALGRPIITTNAPGCRDCVIDGLNGYIVALHSPELLADKLKILIQDSAKRIEMGINSRNFAIRNFDIKIISQELKMLYLSMI
jgi:glycosyltransferase involved in cell wall biosynthesis